MNTYSQLAVAALSIFVAILPCAQAQVTFNDDFQSGKLDIKKWKVATYKSPDSKTGINAGVYVASALDFSQGMLRIKVQQKKGEAGVDSVGGAVISTERFGYGTYDFEMRMSSTSPTPDGPGKAITGAVSSGFIYYNKSESEIDLEFLANENALWVSTWQNPEPTLDPTSRDKSSIKLPNRDLSTAFHHYELIWTSEAVDVYIDGIRVAHQTEHVPHAPASIILQHRGTNSDKWGGLATVGVDRYFYIRRVSFTPQETH